ncbi:MAG: apolipoprotein N-acyltransferase, partial [Planctomycetaceae bacterium]
RPCDLCVWPEFAIRETIVENDLVSITKVLPNVTEMLDTPVVAGCRRLVQHPLELRNAAILLRVGGKVGGFVDKRFLAPVQETVSLLERMLTVNDRTARDNFAPGKTSGVLTLDAGTTIGIGICHDVCFPEWGRDLMNQSEPSVIVTLASEQFDRSGHASMYMLAVTRLRAVESGRAIVRCVAGRGTVAIEFDGHAGEPSSQSPRTCEVVKRSGRTLFTRFDWFPLAIVIVIQIAFGHIAVTRRRHSLSSLGTL